MSWLYRRLIRPALFTQDPEEIHGQTLHALSLAGRHEVLCDALESFLAPPPLPVEVFGLEFPNPVGLAAGMDKAGEAVPTWSAMGFGFTELGGVTQHGQPGNPLPRIFRAIPAEAIVNRMGFNNPGADSLARTLAVWHNSGRWPDHPVGINLGKTKITSLEKAAEDYAHSYRVLSPLADFFVINVSSPNTPNLRQLQDKSALDDILAVLGETGGHSPKPILVKVAPDLSFDALNDVVDVAMKRRIAGIVATNTTVTRPDSNDPGVRAVFSEAGGLSGRPLRARSTEVIRHLFRQTNGQLPIIGVGGIFNAEDAWEKIASGATLVQIYTGIVYEGPTVAKQIVNGLRRKLQEYGCKRLADAVGICMNTK
ncbi:MAG TPA: quinone-dependent dihydroorotate dehydrogenase [Verrucomicrobiota bacterium]|nr:quinone-dependent dihydroorotate dehydrogenase [Verrucomicrobiota bacterium]